MSERTSSKPGIADYVVARRKRKECFLDEIDRLTDWNQLENLLRKTLKRVVNAVGNPAYCVSTVGLDEAMVREYIRKQDQHELRQEQLTLQEMGMNPPK